MGTQRPKSRPAIVDGWTLPLTAAADVDADAAATEVVAATTTVARVVGAEPQSIVEGAMDVSTGATEVVTVGSSSEQSTSVEVSTGAGAAAIVDAAASLESIYLS